MQKISLPALMLVLLAIVVGPIGAPAALAATPTTQSAVKSGQSNRINLNTADAETLKRALSGVGVAKATAIVKHRQAYGPFESVEELLEVTGIGKTLLDRNRDKLVVE